MNFIESFKSMYDVGARSSLLLCTLGSVAIKESDPGSNFTDLILQKSGINFCGFSSALLKNLSQMTSVRSSYLKDFDCDGTVIYKDASNDEHNLLFVELKSTFDTEKINHALNQVVYSFFKFYCISSVCEHFSLDDFSIHFIIACQNFNGFVAKTGATHRISEYSELYPQNPLFRLLRKVVIDANDETSINVKIKDLFLEVNKFVDEMPINPALKDKNITLTLKRTNQYGDSTATMNL